jgi:hypothetical protein
VPLNGSPAADVTVTCPPRIARFRPHPSIFCHYLSGSWLLLSCRMTSPQPFCFLRHSGFVGKSSDRWRRLAPDRFAVDCAGAPKWASKLALAEAVRQFSTELAQRDEARRQRLRRNTAKAPIYPCIIYHFNSLVKRNFDEPAGLRHGGRKSSIALPLAPDASRHSLT